MIDKKRFITHLAIKAVASCLFVLLLTGCKTTERVQWQHDTTTIERVVVQELAVHDTVTIDSTKEQIVTVVRFDTIGRPYEVTKVEWRNRYITAQGTTQTQVIHDTITVQQSHQSGEAKMPAKKNKSVWWVVIVGLVLTGIGIYIKNKCGK